MLTFSIYSFFYKCVCVKTTNLKTFLLEIAG